MPRYSYHCETCGRSHVEPRTIETRDEVRRCPKCQQGFLLRTADAPSFTVKGYNAKNGYSK